MHSTPEEKKLVLNYVGGAFAITEADIPPDPAPVPLPVKDVTALYILAGDVVRLYFYPGVRDGTPVSIKELKRRATNALLLRVGVSPYLVEEEPDLGFVYAEVGPLAVSPTAMYVEYLLGKFR